MKQGKQKKALLPYQTILRASKGDPIAMEAVIGYYRPYMATLAMRESVDDGGHCRKGTDIEMIRRLEAKLTAKVLLFRAE
jgi:hypothetical protein